MVTSGTSVPSSNEFANQRKVQSVRYGYGDGGVMWDSSPVDRSPD